MRDGDNIPIDVLVTDLSTTGFSVDAPLDLDIGAIVRLGLGGAGTASARIMRRGASTYGCQFLQPLDRGRVDAAFAYSENLASIGNVIEADTAQGDDLYDGADRLSRRARMAVILGSASAAWAVVALVWLAI